MDDDYSEESKLLRLHAEIALLKQEIERKTNRLRSSGRLGGTYSNETSSSAPTNAHSSITLQHEPSFSQTISDAEYVIDHERRTLVTPRAMKRIQDGRKRHIKMLAIRKAGVKALWESTEWKEYTQKNAIETDACDRIMIGTDMLGVQANGARLLPISGQKRKEGLVVEWNNWRFLVCKSGLFRRTFDDPVRSYCKYFSRHGSCTRGTGCHFIHDESHKALCRHFLAGKCRGNCTLSHEASEFNTPVCRYHFQDRCLNARCRFSHTLPPHSHDDKFTIWTCRPFAVGGWCDRGRLCPFAHLYNCPDYEESGQCPRDVSCNLTHTVTNHVQQMGSEVIRADNLEVPLEATTEHKKLVVSSYTVDSHVLFLRLNKVSMSPGDQFSVSNLDFSEEGYENSELPDVDFGKVHFSRSLKSWRER